MKKITRWITVFVLVFGLTLRGVEPKDKKTDDPEKVKSSNAVVTDTDKATEEEQDPAWPRKFDYNGSEVILFQPQIDSWQDDKMTARAAFAVKPAGKKELVYGAAWLKCRTATDMNERQVTLYKIKVEKVKIPGHEDKDSIAKKVIQKFFPDTPKTIALDKILENINRQKITSPRAGVKLAKTEPVVFVSDEPSLLINIDGEPQFKKIKGSALSYVYNSGWLILSDKSRKQYYAYTGKGNWFSSDSLDKLTWQKMAKPTEEIEKALKHKRIRRLRKDTDEALKEKEDVRKIFVSTKPAELLEFAGKPVFSSITGTSLKIADNVDNPVILDEKNKKYYTLFAGRWLATNDIASPWKLISAKSLPEEFSKIPDEKEYREILPHIPGTPQAQEARIIAQIPRKAKVNRKEAKLKVKYNGEPEFKPIKGTSLTYAVNTKSAVICCENKYYCCSNAVWFVADNATGPWQVADKIPDEIYSIPPENPLYYVTYVKIYESEPDSVVTGYSSGYMNEYVDDDSGLVVYGTGYNYPSYYDDGIYYCRRPTWGIHVGYHPYYGGYVYRSGYLPPHYYRAYRRGAFMTHGWYGRSKSISTPYRHWNRKVVTDGDQWVRTGKVRAPGRSVRAFESSNGNKGVIVRRGGRITGAVKINDNVYVGRNGNIYRETRNRKWQSYNGKKWNNVAVAGAAVAGSAVAGKKIRDARIRNSSKAKRIRENKRRIKERQNRINRQHVRQKSRSFKYNKNIPIRAAKARRNGFRRTKQFKSWKRSNRSHNRASTRNYFRRRRTPSSYRSRSRARVRASHSRGGARRGGGRRR